MESRALTYLDTHAAVFLFAGEIERLGAVGRYAVEEDQLRISPMVLLEIQFLQEVGRLHASPEEVLTALSGVLQLTVCKISFELIAMAACKEIWTRDPFDRVITASARLGGGRLLSRNRRIAEAFKDTIW